MTHGALEPAASFEGGAFHDSFDKGKSSGTLLLENDVLRFATDAAGEVIVFPLETVEIGSGGAADRLVFITSPRHPGWTLFTHDRKILKNPALKRLSHTSDQVRGIGNKRWMARVFVLTVLIVIVAAIGLLWLLKDPLVEYAASKIPVSVEEKIGETAFAQHTLGRKLLDSDEIQEAVDDLIAPLVVAVGSERYEFECHVIEDATVNAFALPGGITVLHTGLIMKAESAEEILGVLAHEIAHVTEQHSMRGLIQAAGVTLVLSATLGDVGGLAGVLVNNSAFLFQMSFSRDHEREADEVGMEFLVKADIDPRGMVTFFERLRELELEAREELPGGDMELPGLELLSTHPATAERIDELQKAIDQLSKTSYQKYDFDLPAFQELVRKELE